MPALTTGLVAVGIGVVAVAAVVVALVFVLAAVVIGREARRLDAMPARATVEARRTSVQLAEELARVNRAKVDVGQSPPLDLLSAQAEVAGLEVTDLAALGVRASIDDVMTALSKQLVNQLSH